VTDQNFVSTPQTEVTKNGNYFGETRFVLKNLDSSVISFTIDSTYKDTMQVTYSNDSIYFNLSQSPNAFSLPPGFKKGFAIDSNNKYRIDTTFSGGGKLVDYVYEIKTTDSLHANSSFIQRLSSASSSEYLYLFKGKKIQNP
jgi:hypothetical protein